MQWNGETYSKHFFNTYNWRWRTLILQQSTLLTELTFIISWSKWLEWPLRHSQREVAFHYILLCEILKFFIKSHFYSSGETSNAIEMIVIQCSDFAIFKNFNLFTLFAICRYQLRMSGIYSGMRKIWNDQNNFFPQYQRWN